MGRTSQYLGVLLAWCVLARDRPLEWLRVNPDTNQIINERGAAMIFHGVNVVYKIPPWYPNTTVWDPVTSFTEEDIKDLHDWGFNIVRLGVMWPGVRPAPSIINMTYLEEIKKIVDRLGEYGIYTLVDLHQDLISRYGCGEGAPDFLVKQHSGVKDFPWPLDSPYKREPDTDYPLLEQCLSKSNFGYYYSSKFVNDIFSELYTPGSPLHVDLHLFWRTVATFFKDDPNVIGYDLINEPPAGNLFTEPWNFVNFFGGTARKYLQPLYESLHNEIRKVDQRHILFFEPSLNNGMIFTGFTHGPGGPEYSDRQVLSHHIYCPAVTQSGCVTMHWFCELFESIFIYLKSIELKNWRCGGMITEFGALCEEPDCITEVQRLLRKADEMLEGWIYWQYKEYHDLTTANTDFTEGLYYTNGTLQKLKLAALTQPYARIVAGEPMVMRYDTSSGEYLLRYKARAMIAASVTELYVNKEYYGRERPKVEISPKTAAGDPEFVDVESRDGAKFALIRVSHRSDLLPGTIVEIRLKDSSEKKHKSPQHQHQCCLSKSLIQFIICQANKLIGPILKPTESLEGEGAACGSVDSAREHMGTISGSTCGASLIWQYFLLALCLASIFIPLL